MVIIPTTLELPLEDLVLVEYDGELLVEFGHEEFRQLIPGKVGGYFHKRHLAQAWFAASASVETLKWNR